MYKYNLSILGVFKNESSFLKEWVEHYLNRDIDHIYLLNDNSTDNYLDIISPYINKKLVTLQNTSIIHDDKDIKDRQPLIYNYYYKYIISETKWVGVFDIDEFVYSPQFANLQDLVNIFDKTTFEELIIDWYWFGSNGHKVQPEKIVESFTMRDSIKGRYLYLDNKGYGTKWCCKTISKTKYMINLRHHYNLYNSPRLFGISGGNPIFNFNINLSDIQFAYLNHYIGSESYYFNKKSRGSCNNTSLINRNQELYNCINKDIMYDNRLMEQNKTLKSLDRPADV